LSNEADTWLLALKKSLVSPAQGARYSMASQYPADYHEDPTPLVLEEAFYDVWAVLAAHEPHRDRTHDHERKVELSRTLMEFVANGVTNIAELRRLGVKSLSLPPSH
jgi:hypothetical protein